MQDHSLLGEHRHVFLVRMRSASLLAEAAALPECWAQEFCAHLLQLPYALMSDTWKEEYQKAACNIDVLGLHHIVHVGTKQ